VRDAFSGLHGGVKNHFQHSFRPSDNETWLPLAARVAFLIHERWTMWFDESCPAFGVFGAAATPEENRRRDTSPTKAAVSRPFMAGGTV